MAVGGMRKVFSNRNVLVISLTNSVATFFMMVYTPYWAKFLKDDIGLEITQIGLLRALQRSNQLLFTFPGGLLADRIGRKKVTLMGAAARMFTPLIYLFAQDWNMLLLGTIVNSMQSISTAAYTAMIAESLPRDQMGAGYGAFGMVRRAPMLFTGIVGGVLMDTMGIGMGTRICFVGGIVGAVIIFFARYFFLTETLKRKPGQRTTFKEDLREVIPMFQGSLRAMQVTSAIYQFAVGLTSELIIIYVTEIIGLSYTEWGLISTIMSTISLITALPGGMMADKYNRVQLNVMARSIAPVTNLGYIYLRSFWQVLGVRMIAGIGMGLSGVEMGMIGGATWESLMADLVPPEKRGRFSGMMSTFNGIISLPSPYVGAQLWVTPGIGPEGTLWINIVLGLASTLVFGRFVKDPRYEKKEQKLPADDDEGVSERA